MDRRAQSRPPWRRTGTTSPDPARSRARRGRLHAFSVTSGVITDEPLTPPTGFTLGEHAVNGFFAISGFLVTMSFDQRGWRDYVIARTLRIAPGLIVAVLAVALLLGAAMTALLSSSTGEPDLRRFIDADAHELQEQHRAAGRLRRQPLHISHGNGLDPEIRGPVLRGRPPIGLVGLLRSRAAALALVAGLALAWASIFRPMRPRAWKRASPAADLAFGGALYVWRDRPASRPPRPRPIWPRG